MTTDTAEAISCDRLEFLDEDAGVATAEVEFVAPPAVPDDLPPADETLAAVRKCWLKVLRRFAEPVPGNKDCLRVSGGDTGGTIAVHCRGARPGTTERHHQPHGTTVLTANEADVSDKAFLILYARAEAEAGDEVVATVVSWKEIAHIAFRPVPSATRRSHVSPA